MVAPDNGDARSRNRSRARHGRGRLAGALAILAAPLALHGCLFNPFRSPFSREITQVDLQVQTLERRVTQLEGVRAGVPSLTGSLAAGAGGSGLLTADVRGAGAPGELSLGDPELFLASRVEEGAGGGIRWPGLPSRDAWAKLLRGLTNIATGWVELPKRVHETTHRSGAGVGFTWGILRGIGHGFIRTAGGVYEAVTFPFPAPPNYRPVIRPSYVFICEDDRNAQP